MIITYTIIALIIIICLLILLVYTCLSAIKEYQYIIHSEIDYYKTLIELKSEKNDAGSNSGNDNN